MPALADGVVTIYSADGLHDGDPSWLGNQFDAFTKETGIKIQYVEAGSSGVVDRIAKEKSNTQADVLVTLPPFMQKAAADDLLEAYSPAGADKIADHDKDADGRYYAMVNNYPNFIYNAEVLKDAPKAYDDLLDPKFKQKLQYSTPGQAGDGTALMLQTFHAFGSKEKGLEFLKKLQVNNLGPSASTGKLTALVNKGELYVANGDMQMNTAQSADNPNIKIFFPEGPDGKKTTFALPYYIALVKGGPNADNGKKLVDFLLSAEAQKQISSVARGFPVRTDVKPDDETFKNLNAMLEGVEIWSPDWAKVLDTLKDDVAAYNQAISSN
jgi:2-aminoethylphosphonate transport system substrate-binding protein